MKKITILSKPNLLLLGVFLSTTIISQVLINSVDQKLKWQDSYNHELQAVKSPTDIMFSGKTSMTPIQTSTNDAMVAAKTKTKENSQP